MDNFIWEGTHEQAKIILDKNVRFSKNGYVSTVNNINDIQIHQISNGCLIEIFDKPFDNPTMG